MHNISSTQGKYANVIFEMDTKIFHDVFGLFWKDRLHKMWQG